MINDETFVAIKAWDRTYDRLVADYDTLVDRKNSQLERLAAQLAAVQRELQIERGKRKLAELKLMRVGRH